MVELQSGIEKTAAAKIQVVAVSYDAVETLDKFAKKQEVSFRLLSDSDSKVIKAFGILNEKARGKQAGIPHPCTFLIDRSGVIRAVIDGTVRKRHTVDELLAVAKEKLKSS